MPINTIYNASALKLLSPKAKRHDDIKVFKNDIYVRLHHLDDITEKIYEEFENISTSVSARNLQETLEAGSIGDVTTPIRIQTTSLTTIESEDAGVSRARLDLYNDLSSNSVKLYAQDIVANTERSLTFSSAGMVVTDTTNTRGLQYAADYSANFIDRSLVDKKYVDEAIAASSPALDLDDVIENGGIANTSNSILIETVSGNNTGKFLLQDYRMVLGTLDSTGVFDHQVFSNNNEVGLLSIYSPKLCSIRVNADENRIDMEVDDGSVSNYTVMTSTGLGVGMASGETPDVELHVKGTASILRLETTSTVGNNYLEFHTSSARKGYIGYGSASLNDLHIVNDGVNNDINLYTTTSGGTITKAMTIDGSQNVEIVGDLGVGTAPVSGSVLTLATTTDNLEFVESVFNPALNSPSTQTVGYIQVEIGGNICYLQAYLNAPSGAAP